MEINRLMPQKASSQAEDSEDFIRLFEVCYLMLYVVKRYTVYLNPNPTLWL